MCWSLRVHTQFTSMARVLDTVPQSQVIVSWNSAQREEHTGMTRAEERGSRGDPEGNLSVIALEIKSQVPGVGVAVSLWRVNSTEETQDQGGPGPKTTCNPADTTLVSCRMGHCAPQRGPVPGKP